MRYGVVVLLVALGCGGSGSCPLLDGTYEVTFEERMGSCGPQDPAVQMFSGKKEPPPSNCDVSHDVSEDMCTQEADRACVLNDGTLLESTSAIHTSGDGSKAEGVMDLCATGPRDRVPYCCSTYDVTYKRL